MKTIITLFALALLSFTSCRKETKDPLSNEMPEAFCYHIHDAETGKAIKGAQIEIDLETTSGNSFEKLLFSDKTGNACAALPETEEFHRLKIIAPGYLTETFSENLSKVALIKPCTLKIHVVNTNENKPGDLLIIDYKISSEQSEQILIQGETDTTFVRQADPRGGKIKWCYQNTRDSLVLHAKSGQQLELSIKL